MRSRYDAKDHLGRRGIACFLLAASALASGETSSPAKFEMNSDNAHVEASGNATAINQLNARYFMVIAHEYNVPIYNVTYQKIGPATQSPLAQINKSVLQVRTLYQNRYYSEGDARLDQAFKDFFGAPDLVQTDSGLLTLTNLHILKAQRLESQNAGTEAMMEYLKPLDILKKRPKLQKDYVAKIIDKSVMYEHPYGVSFVIDERCPLDPNRKCPGLVALRLKLNVTDLPATAENLSESITLITQFLDDTRPQSATTPSLVKYGSVLAIRANLVASVLNFYRPILAGMDETPERLNTIRPVLKGISADLHALQSYIGPANSKETVTDEDVVALRFMLLLIQDIIVVNAWEHASNDDLQELVKALQDSVKFLPDRQQVSADETRAAVSSCLADRSTCHAPHVVWHTTTADQRP